MVIASQPLAPRSAHHKKRQGHHHNKVSKHYIKTYWPYLPMLLIVVLGFVINMGLGARHAVMSYATNISPTGLLEETNIQRSSNGRTALSLNNLLSQAAQQKANDMVARNYWSHTSPEGTQPWEVISSVGYTYVVAGENLAYGFDTSAATLAGWMNSAGHKANVLNVNYQEVGFGIANSADYQGDGEQTIVVAMYASPKKAVAPVAKTTPKKSTPSPAPTAAVKPVEQPAAPVAPVAAAEPEKTETPPAAAPVAGNTPLPSSQELTSKEIARVDVLTSGNAQWAALALTALVTIGAITFVYKHGRMWRKYLIRGETFVMKHPMLDMLVVAVVVVGFILTRTTGFIH